MTATNDDTGVVVGSNSLLLGGIGATLTIASSSVTVTDRMHKISGSGVLKTISVSGGNPASSAQVAIIPSSGATWTVSTSGGNIAGAAPTITALVPVFFEWDGTSWYGR